MFINFWYVAGTAADEITDKPLKRRMLGQDFVLFRDSAGPGPLSEQYLRAPRAARWPWRQGALDDGVQCPYHGWRFDGDGRCHKIPSLGADAKIPGRACGWMPTPPAKNATAWFSPSSAICPKAERPPMMEIPDDGIRARRPPRWLGGHHPALRMGLRLQTLHGERHRRGPQ